MLRCDPPRPGDRFVNSTWKVQDQPFAGDMINSYNDGPNESGGILGPFYELESSSPALALAPGASGRHDQTMIHLSGDRKGLDKIARKMIGVGLDEIERALPESH